MRAGQSFAFQCVFATDGSVDGSGREHKWPGNSYDGAISSKQVAGCPFFKPADQRLRRSNNPILTKGPGSCRLCLVSERPRPDKHLSHGFDSVFFFTSPLFPTVIIAFLWSRPSLRAHTDTRVLIFSDIIYSTPSSSHITHLLYFLLSCRLSL